jgi:hypothetical protein
LKAAFISNAEVFFHVYHDLPELDYEGEELPDKHAAWKEATVMAGQTLQGIDGKLKPGREWRMEVTDEFANPLYVLPIITSILDKGGLTPAQKDNFIEAAKTRIPLGRTGTAAEVAAAALYLAADATYTTGAELFVDGGLIDL